MRIRSVLYRLVLKALMVVTGIAWSLGGEAASVITVNSADCQLIGSQAMYYTNAAEEATLPEMVALRGEFKTESRDVYASPASTHPIWTLFSIENKSDTALWIDIHNSNLLEITCYKLDANYQIINTYETGVFDKPVVSTPRANTFWIPLLAADEKEIRHFFIRTKTLVANELPFYVGGEAALFENKQIGDFIAFFFIGCIGMLLLYNVFVYLTVRDHLHLLYSINLLVLLFIGPYFNNFPVIKYLLGDTLTFQYPHLWFWLIFVAAAIFTVRYLELKTKARTFYYLLNAEIILFLLFIPVGLLSEDKSFFARFYLLLTLVFYLTCLAAGYYALWKERNEKTVLYCLGWTGFVIGIAILMCVRNGLLPYSIPLRNAAYFGWLIEMLAFSVALGQQINRLRLKEKDLNLVLTNKNEDLVSLNESLDSFNYHVSHDLKTVLNNTHALTLMARKYNEREDREKVDEILEKLEKVNGNGVETVQSFLSLGRFDVLQETGISHLIYFKKELARIVNNHELADKIDITIHAPENVQIEMHEKALEGIFLNLFTNSIKYNRNRPAAKIDWTKVNGELTISYSDNGIGIDIEKYGGRLFKPFQRATEGNDVEGTGVGLYLVRKIIRQYGGTIDVSSKLDEGSTFVLKFPGGIVRQTSE